MAEGSNIWIPSLQVLSYNEETAYNENAGTAADLDGTQTSTLGILGEEIKLPDPEIEFHQHRNVGSGANLHILQAGARRLSGSIPVTLMARHSSTYLVAMLWLEQTLIHIQSRVQTVSQNQCVLRHYIMTELMTLFDIIPVR
jgi:hypothetical protein